MILVENVIDAKIERVFEFYTKPVHIEKWNYADDSWETVNAKNDLRVGGKFTSTMRAKDLSQAFDFYGTYTLVDIPNRLNSVLGDGRNMHVEFTKQGDATLVKVHFDPETVNPESLQKLGWQLILDHFKRYVESIK